MFNVSSLISAKTGLPPQYIMALAVAAKVMGVVIASSPVEMPATAQAAWSAAVPLDTATAYLAPQYSATFLSNSSTLGP
jgi:hypothetical protein